jgi:hypothetical protein
MNIEPKDVIKIKNIELKELYLDVRPQMVVPSLSALLSHSSW